MAASLELFLLSVCLVVASEDVTKTVTVKPGETATLRCTADENKVVVAAEWSRNDLGPQEFVILLRGGSFDLDGQPAAFRNRVALKDKDRGDLSLILRNATVADAGTYECRVSQKTNNRRKRANLPSDPICTLKLEVKSDEPKLQGDDNRGLKVGLTVGLLLAIGALIGGFIFVRSKKGGSML